MDGNYRRYVVGSRHGEGRGKLFRFPRNPVRAQLWGEKISRLCTTEEAGILHYKFLCRDHFLPIDFTTPAGIHINRLAVPCGLDLRLNSIPQSSPPLLPTLQLHVWSEIEWHYFRLASVLFRFELSASDLVSCTYVNI